MDDFDFTDEDLMEAILGYRTDWPAFLEIPDTPVAQVHQRPVVPLVPEAAHQEAQRINPVAKTRLALADIQRVAGKPIDIKNGEKHPPISQHDILLGSHHYSHRTVGNDVCDSEVRPNHLREACLDVERFMEQVHNANQAHMPNSPFPKVWIGADKVQSEADYLPETQLQTFAVGNVGNQTKCYTVVEASVDYIRRDHTCGNGRWNKRRKTSPNRSGSSNNNHGPGSSGGSAANGSSESGDTNPQGPGSNSDTTSSSEGGGTTLGNASTGQSQARKNGVRQASLFNRIGKYQRGRRSTDRAAFFWRPLATKQPPVSSAPALGVTLGDVFDDKPGDLFLDSLLPTFKDQCRSSDLFVENQREVAAVPVKEPIYSDSGEGSNTFALAQREGGVDTAGHSIRERQEHCVKGNSLTDCSRKNSCSHDSGLSSCFTGNAAGPTNDKGHLSPHNSRIGEGTRRGGNTAAQVGSDSQRSDISAALIVDNYRNSLSVDLSAEVSPLVDSFHILRIVDRASVTGLTPSPLDEIQKLTTTSLHFVERTQSNPIDPPEEHPTPENHNATLYQAFRGPKEALEVLCANADSPLDFRMHEVFLVRDFDEKEQPTQAYALDKQYCPIDLAHGDRHSGWGCIVFGTVCDRVGLRSFVLTSKQVAIKRLRKGVVHKYLARGGQENPYKEAARMQELGDSEHVLELIEFLEDEEYLYIVTPMATGKYRTLSDAIAWGDPRDVMEPERVQQIFSKILKILQYLDSKNVCHRDLSPSNFLFLTDDNLVAFDLALSIKIPIDKTSGERCLIAPQGRCGTLPFMAPEVYANRPFDGGAIDLWSAATILYCLLTNQLLYNAPCEMDPDFNFFVCAHNLSINPGNEKALALIDSTDENTMRKLSFHALAHAYISDEALSLLENLLAVEPERRYTLAQAMESMYVQSTASQ